MSGPGTGVLAIAAVRTGSSRAVGTDIDGVLGAHRAREPPASTTPAPAFVRADGLAHRRVAQDAPYDLVFANILARPLVRLAPGIRRALKPGGTAILSGLLRSQQRFVFAAYLGRGFRPETPRSARRLGDAGAGAPLGASGTAAARGAFRPQPLGEAKTNVELRPQPRTRPAAGPPRIVIERRLDRRRRRRRCRHRRGRLHRHSLDPTVAGPAGSRGCRPRVAGAQDRPGRAGRHGRRANGRAVRRPDPAEPGEPGPRRITPRPQPPQPTVRRPRVRSGPGRDASATAPESSQTGAHAIVAALSRLSRPGLCRTGRRA